MQGELTNKAHRESTIHPSAPKFGSGSVRSRVEVRDVIARLKNSPYQERCELWPELIASPAGRDVFRALLVSKGNEPLKMEALLAMQLMGDDGVKIMREAFRRSDTWTRAQLVGIFASLKDGSAAEELLQSIEDSAMPPEKKMLALNALANCPKQYEDRVVRLLDSKDPLVRSRVAKIIAQRKFLKGKQRLRRMLLEENLASLTPIIEALNELGDNMTLEEVMDLREEGKSAKQAFLKRLNAIAKKYGSAVYAVVRSIVLALLSLGYALSSIFGVLNLIARDVSQGKRGSSTLPAPQDPKR
ncbi:MAG: hypothetical protein N3H30_01515 [Candidatus Micrarchaeota archaeon]|nr:hypothetical protein [Candidatus Micrarchaeota archaeon]